ncbi:hypothetical protein LQ327_08995 [Actinomycetospora endophytica]|uniref:Uncharacterized protein n=1 Tax=Actinomycetospora endophytica TaxID=2291215 RepID=A0ABS8P5J0_9PSEU|nr:hypothetical protein [Actinomycetospora endophytica]MCD2193518.1 hypothetical protein [Actinomycetospora endophytica]
MPSPEGAEQATPGEGPHAAGAAPGEFHPEPRPLSPRGGGLGPMVGAHSVRDAVESVFTRRIPSYVAEARRRHPEITNPPLADWHDWVNQPGVGPVNPGNAPRFVIFVPGTLSVRRKGDGSHAVDWMTQVQMWLWGSNWRSVDDRLGLYLASARMCLLQNPSLDGFARSVTWRGETISPVAPNQATGNHTWGQARLEVAIHVDPVVSAFAGPAPLDPDTPPPDPTAITGAEITLT